MKTPNYTYNTIYFLLIILIGLCSFESVVPERIQTSKSFSYIDRNFVQSTDTKAEISTTNEFITSAVSKNKKEDNNTKDDAIATFFGVLLKHGIKIVNNTKNTTKSSSHTFGYVISESTYLNSYDHNDTSIPITKNISKYLNLWENLTSYLQLKEVQGDSKTDQGKNFNLTYINPIYLFSNFTNNQFFNPEAVSLCNDSDLSIDEKDNRTYEPTNLQEFLYPPWKNLTKTEQDKFLQLAQGASRRYGKVISIGLTSYYTFLLVVGIPGNVLTCTIIITNSYMRIAPNFFLLNIALADLLTLILGKK